MSKRFGTLSVSAVFMLSVLVSAQDYSLVALPTLGGARTSASAINENGQVTGDSGTTGYAHAFLWSRTAGIQDISAPGSFESRGVALNASGQVAGFFDPCLCQLFAFFWSPATGMENLGALGGGHSFATGINQSTEVVGTYLDQNLSQNGFLWTPQDGMQSLTSFGCVGCLANAVNDNGEIAGAVLRPDGSQHAFVWTLADGMTDLGTLGGPNSLARAINILGQVVGSSDTASGAQHAFFWSTATGLQDLGTLPGYNNAYASAISATGRVVGSSWNPGRNTGLPFSWTQADGMQRLGPYSKKNISSADGVNTGGQILLSTYSFPLGGPVTYLFTPVMHTTLTSTPNPSQPGAMVTFTAQVNSSVQGPPPDGEIVTFTSGGKVVATAPVHAGTASFTEVVKSTRTFQASYPGDSIYSPSKSKFLKQIVTN